MKKCLLLIYFSVAVIPLLGNNQWSDVSEGISTYNGIKYRFHKYRQSISVVSVDASLTNVIIPDTLEVSGTEILNTKDKTVFSLQGGKYIVSSIESDAFSTCHDIIDVVLPKTITTIDDNPFKNSSKLKSITINIENLTYSDIDGVLYNKDNTEIICFPRGKTDISYKIPNSVQSIRTCAFYGCTYFSTINIPNTVNTIGENAFYGVKHIVYTGSATGSPWGATYMNKYVDENGLIYENEKMTMLLSCPRTATNIAIPNSVTSIGGYAFYGCSSLTSITIPNSVTSIGRYAFYGCSSLTSVTIPNSVTSIGEGAFWNCGINKIYFSGTMEEWCTKSFSPYSISSSYTLYINGEAVTNAVIPISVTSIGNEAFYGCNNLTSITIPNSVTIIGDYTFYGCSSLTSVTIPNSVTSIGDAAFKNCSSLPIIDNIRYADTYLVGAIDKTLSSYTIKESTKWIGEDAFRGCSSLTSVTIPNSVTNIGNYAFRDCKGLTSVTIPNSVTSIGKYTFSECSSLTSVTIPNSVTSIGEGAFRNCGINKIYFSGTMEEWCTKSFSPSSISSSYTLYINDEVTNAVIPNSITNIGNEAFYGCNNLTSITIPNSVTIIGLYAFRYCSSLQSVTMESETPPRVYLPTFDEDVIIYVPLGTMQTYQKTNWTMYNIRVFDTSYKISEVSPTSAVITLSASRGSENMNTFIAACGIDGGEEFSGNTLEHIGLEPNFEYKDIPFYVRTTKGDVQTITASFTTSALKLTTLASKAVSDNTAILLAETNMSDLETSCGFEYKRNDAPEDMPATQVICPVANGLMAGRLKGLRNDTYYKYRAFYKSTAGNMHYGDWQYIFTGDVAVEFDPILYTYAAQFVGEHEATLKGYALAGSEDFTEQGFEYWAERRTTNSAPRRAPQSAIGEKKTIQSSGISMRVILSDLDEGTVYKYRTYAKIGDKTLYGTEMSFTTEGEYIPNALEETDAIDRAPSAKKVFENGQIYILLPNGTRYNLQGMEVK